VRGVSKAGRNRENARQRIARQRAEEARRRKQRLWAMIGGGAVVVIGVVVAVVLVVTSGGGGSGGGNNSPIAAKEAPLSSLGTLEPAPAAGPLGPEGVPIPAGQALADPSSATTGQTIDGISCSEGEQTLFHIHAHLTIFVNGVAKQVPAGIGIPGAKAQNTAQGPFVDGGTCFYWLHTHAADGIVHIESPVKRTYTLGQFFDEWGQPLGTGQVGTASGKVVTIVDGKVYQGNPRNVPLTAHEQIQLEVGSPLVAPESVKFPGGL
jgi:hypothetical protein